MTNPNIIQGKVALITGGAKNLGALLARELAHKGAKRLPSITIARQLRQMPSRCWRIFVQQVQKPWLCRLI
ncbi:hypothetical protein [Snodgrassella sp. CFCC 13594]|uniref:hypothetical protein n=1 Tax=Snodgrassella sp. CFCC 13594 TaxID=1775559 RepID=UPI000A547617|nr:hypothetical protein [Snodgrassella sp. CFCC 13594]